jgi:MYXO-CTERM domain-containing protein
VGVGMTRATGDADGNGMVNSADLAVWRDQFGFTASTTATTAAVPEPGAAVLLALGALAVRRKRS